MRALHKSTTDLGSKAATVSELEEALAKAKVRGSPSCAPVLAELLRRPEVTEDELRVMSNTQ